MSEGLRCCGFVSVLGATNAGKSTLVNRLVGVKVAITTHKVQTTRSAIRGVMVRGCSQVVLTDTPGFFAPKRRFDRAMQRAAEGAREGVDAVIFLVDAYAGLHEGVERGLEKLEGAKVPVWLVLNKTDKVLKKEDLLKFSSLLHERGNFAKSFMVSSTKGGGVDHLAESLADFMPEGEWHYEEEVVSDMTDRQFASELTREKVMEVLHDELPFQMMVETVHWKDKGSILWIEQMIVVKSGRHKGMVLGEGGRRIRLLGEKSRKVLEEVLGCRIYLSLRVKVRKKWDEERINYESWGLEYGE